MRVLLRRAVIVLSLPMFLTACKGQQKARVAAIEAALKPLNQIEIETGSPLNVSPGAVPYLRKLASARLIVFDESPQGYWDTFASQTYMEGAKPYSIRPTQRLAQLAVNPRPAAGAAIEPSLPEVIKKLESNWNFYARETVFLGVHLFGNSSGGTRIDGNPPTTLSLMSDYPRYLALAQKGFIVLDEVDLAGVPQSAFGGAAVDRAAKVSLTPTGEGLATLDKKANTATFVFGTYKVDEVLVNEPIETNEGIYRLIEGTQTFELQPTYADIVGQLRVPSDRQRRFRVIFTYRGYDGYSSDRGRFTTPPEWRVADASNGNYTAEDVGPRSGAYESSMVPPTLAALRRNAKSDDKYTWRIVPGELKIAEILRDDEYTGPLATPGESFRLVLASITCDSAPGRTPLPPELLGLLPGRLRSVVKYDEFAKSWKVVAMDVGARDNDSWLSTNVR